MPITLGSNARCVYTYTEAQAAIAGYAFGERPLSWQPPRRARVLGPAPAPDLMRRRWAYQTYDCVPASPGPLDAHDILLTAGLNSDIGASTTAGILAIARQVSACLARLVGSPPFWALNVNHVRAMPPAATPGIDIWGAWWLMMGVPGSGVAITHKVLHHKDPHHFPLLDSITLRFYATGRAWSGIHADLTRNAVDFALLEGWFSGFAQPLGGVPLTQLRLHDILLWLDGRGDRVAAIAAGQPLLQAQAPPPPQPPQGPRAPRRRGL